MTTINLRQLPEQEVEKKSVFSKYGGLTLSLGILVLVLLIIFGLKFWSSSLEKRGLEADAAIQAENAKLAGTDTVEQVMDLQTRIQYIKDSLKNNPDSQVILDHFSSAMIGGVTANSLNYDSVKKSISATFTASNFSDVAKQLLSFKSSSTYFTSAKLMSISRTDQGISFGIDMNIK